MIAVTRSAVRSRRLLSAADAFDRAGTGCRYGPNSGASSVTTESGPVGRPWPTSSATPRTGPIESSARIRRAHDGGDVRDDDLSVTISELLVATADSS